MAHPRRYWLEKLQVRIAAVLFAAAVYFPVWSVLRPSDPAEPLSFIPAGQGWQLVGFGVLLCVLGSVGAVLTISARPSGAILAVAVGASALCLRSSAARGLLWLRQENLGSLYVEFLGELLLLGLLMCLAALVASVVRNAVSTARPAWTWPGADPATTKGTDRTGEPRDLRAALMRLGVLESGALLLIPGKSTGHSSRSAAGSGVQKAIVGRSVACLLTGLIVSAAAIVILMQSADRGQVLFAMFVSFLAAMFLGHQLFPTPCMAIAWAMPVLSGAGFYALAALSAKAGATGQAWLDAPFYARALPIDWMAAGGAGALMGYWMSWTKHEQRLAELGAGKKES